jgi:hypothetical protein
MTRVYAERQAPIVKEPFSSMTSPQKRTAETPGAQRTQKRIVTDAWRSVRGHDALWNPSLRTLRLCGDIPFCSGFNDLSGEDSS